MRYNFYSALKAFKDDEISELAEDNQGLRFLVLRSLSRSEYLREVAVSMELDVDHLENKKLLQTLFESDIDLHEIKGQIELIHKRERNSRRQGEKQLLNELYQLKDFSWGGLHQNSLERNIVDNYVKKIQSYDSLCKNIDERLYPSMRSYVLCSWYNHWTSIIIEDIFKEHKRVLPAVGLIKKIDFFIDDVPFDLKVTYLPEGYVKDKRRKMKLGREISILKKICRNHDMHIPDNLPETRLLEDLWNKIQDHPSDEAVDAINTLREFRNDMVKAISLDATELIRWLYENQGVRRFDASNRIFLILVSTSNYFESWKLKRARPFLIKTIHKELDEINLNNVDRIQFNWDGEPYSTTSKAIIVAK